MKLILASDLSFLLSHGYRLTGIPKDQMCIGYVTTASKVARGKGFFVEVKEAISKAGYFFEEFDIEGKTTEEMYSFFQDKNVIHVEGGNTFYLLKAIRETGFDTVLGALLNEGKIYIGTSAGAYVMCPTIEVADWNTDGKDRFGMTNFTALNYVPFVLKVHYTDEQAGKIRANMPKLTYPLRILRDGQGIVLENGEFTFVGGQEVSL
jgi:dipeptidase E